MDLALLLLAVGLVGVVAAVATGRIRGGLDEPVRGRPDRALPDGPLTGRDIERVRFNLAARGYRMDEVDEALDRLRAELDDRDARIAQLSERVGEPERDPDVGSQGGTVELAKDPRSADAAT